MKKHTKELTALICGISMVAALLTGCGSGSGSQSSDAPAADTQAEAATEADNESEAPAQAETPAESDVVLEVETSWTGDMLDSLQVLMNQFTEETGIGVELIAPGDDYENVMKTRMASGDLPDLWETHGWSTTRYAEYLATVNDQPWLSKVKESIKKTVTDPDGNVYVAPLSIDPASICYNREIFEEAGVDATTIRTWADFEAACDKILTTGKVPVYVGGKSVNNIANLFEVMAPGFLTNEDVADNQADALLDGSFDWAAHWAPIAEMLDGWQQKGYFNSDILTASDDAAIQALANGEGAIVISGNHTITQALGYNPDAKLGIMAIPSPNEGGKLYVSSGEGTCYGMWKDSEHPEECKKLLEFFARDDISVQIATINGKIPAMEGVSNDDEYVTKEFNIMMDAFGDDLIFVNYFDRVYLPSGMWNDMGVSGNEVFMNPGQGVDKCVETIKTAYEEKIAQ
ncbi:MAG: ABC transporter substrate-binding protein [Clostridium sp.]|nr:ABC transporter substrate-binding protein [Clostridium sp.]